MPKLHSERARTPVVPRRSDVLKQDFLQSFTLSLRIRLGSNAYILFIVQTIFTYV
ncbi:hypothetical protein TPHV1_130074 [Treponema phagedenis]|uniref:Uncharacterized protein n=1 Tax=Treponema phagedenis TaxID=162 RepID=A0A0B7GWN9_TREPH|nr:hypothetical protein TPHV1_130074 [Treponema phagedenis]